MNSTCVSSPTFPVQVPNDGLNRMCTPTMAPVASQATTDVATVDEDDAHEESSSSSKSVADNDMTTFRPIYVIGEWEDENEDKRISLAVLMPSGLCTRKKDHDVRVISGSRSIEISVVWPQAMTDMVYLHKSWLNADNTFLCNHRRLK